MLAFDRTVRTGGQDGPAPARPAAPRGGADRLLALQRLAGNRAVAGALAPVAQRCGATPADVCPCHDGEAAEPAAPVSRDAEDGAAAPPPAGAGDLAGKLRAVAADLRALHAFGATRAERDGMTEAAQPDLAALLDCAGQVEAAAAGDPAQQAAVLSGFGPSFVAEAEARAAARARESGADLDDAGEEPVAQRYAVRLPPVPPGPAVQRQVEEALGGAGVFLLGTAEAAAPVEAATGPPGWIVGGLLAVAGVALIGIGVYMASSGNVADTGIMEEVTAMIAAGLAASVCDALAILMDSAKRAGDTARQQRIKRTQKAKGCRHSRHS
ncbi:MAG: polymorphic toxin type 34 domain-containing protein [Mycobacteriales bacterium]